MKIRLVAVLIIQCVNLVAGANILSIFPFALKSHLKLGEIIIRELASRGHTITLVSQIGLKVKHENVTEVQINGVQEHLREMGFIDSDFKNKRDRSVIEELITTVYETTAVVNYTLGNSEMQKLIHSKKSFDLLMIDSFFTDSLLGLGYYWKIPVIAISPLGANKLVNEMVGNPHRSAYNPSIFSGYTDEMTLVQRLKNSLLSAFEQFTYSYMYIPSQESVYKRYFENLLPKRQKLPELMELIHNVSLVLINSHPAINYPRPHVPNMIQIGGAHINRSVSSNELSPKILQFLDEASSGVIFMNLGNTRNAELSSEQIAAFLSVFTSYRPGIRIIWKFNNTSLTTDRVENILIEPFLSQQTVLSHPNVILFISQGCLFSLMESITFAKPMISIPVFSDEHFHTALTEKHGIGIKLDINNLTDTTIRNSIDQMITNIKFYENALKLSQLFQDNSIDPLKNAIYYIEYILRTNGAIHYRSTVVNLTVWQQHLIDVTLIIIIGIALIIAIPSTIICILLRKNNSLANNKIDNKFLSPTKRNRRNSKKSKIL